MVDMTHNVLDSRVRLAPSAPAPAPAPVPPVDLREVPGGW
jgi:hypothetical protein